MVYFNGCYSDIRSVKHGVPQGSCLGPLLYTIFTNDLPHVLCKSSISMFADDTTLYLAGETISEVKQTLENELLNVVSWIESNKLILNVEKTASIVLGSNHILKANPQLNLCLKNTPIKQTEKVKLLGVLIDSNLSWEHQTNNIVSKMGRSLAVIKRCSKYLPKHISKNVIQSLVLSHLDYCSVVWSNTSMSNIKKLQREQNKAARVALRCGFRNNVEKMHEQLSWLKVKNRWLYTTTTFLHSIIETKTPSMFYNKLPFSCNLHQHFTRHCEELRLFHRFSPESGTTRTPDLNCTKLQCQNRLGF